MSSPTPAGCEVLGPRGAALLGACGDLPSAAANWLLMFPKILPKRSMLKQLWGTCFTAIHVARGDSSVQGNLSLWRTARQMLCSDAPLKQQLLKSGTSEFIISAVLWLACERGDSTEAVAVNIHMMYPRTSLCTTHWR